MSEGETVIEATDSAPETVLGAVQVNWEDSVPLNFRTPEGKVNNEAVYKSYQSLQTRMTDVGLPPESFDKYEITAPKDADGNDLDIPLDKFDALKENLHKVGLTQKQFDTVMNEYFSAIPNMESGLKEAYGLTPEIAKERAEESLRAEWKTDVDFKNNMQLAIKGYEIISSQMDVDFDKIANNPEAIKMLSFLGRNSGEDGGARGSIPSMDIDKLMASDAYRNPRHPEHQYAQKQVTGWFERQYGDTPARV